MFREIRIGGPVLRLAVFFKMSARHPFGAARPSRLVPNQPVSLPWARPNRIGRHSRRPGPIKSVRRERRRCFSSRRQRTEAIVRTNYFAALCALLSTGVRSTVTHVSDERGEASITWFAAARSAGMVPNTLTFVSEIRSCRRGRRGELSPFPCDVSVRQQERREQESFVPLEHETGAAMMRATRSLAFAVMATTLVASCTGGGVTTPTATSGPSSGETFNVTGIVADEHGAPVSAAANDGALVERSDRDAVSANRWVRHLYDRIHGNSMDEHEQGGAARAEVVVNGFDWYWRTVPATSPRLVENFRVHRIKRITAGESIVLVSTPRTASASVLCTGRAGESA
jgi:hypothetical protein